MVEENSTGGTGDCCVDIGVLENDVGRFASQFQRDFLQVAGGGVNDQLSDFGGAGKCDLVDVRVRRESGAGSFAIAGDNVDDAFGKPSFHDEFAKAQSR